MVQQIILHNLPGFIRFCGSSACFIVRITSTRVAVLLEQVLLLAHADAVFAGARAAQRQRTADQPALNAFTAS